MALHIPNDWYPGTVPPNVVTGEDVYLDSSYSFAAFRSQRNPGLLLGTASGVYDRASFVTGTEALIEVGPYTTLNGCYLIAEERISMGAHCLLAWGVTVTDCWDGMRLPLGVRRRLLEQAAGRVDRHLMAGVTPRPVTIEDNVWIGFDAVILPGVRLGHGCVIGAKTVISDDVPPYAIVAGDPPRILRHLPPSDDEVARDAAVREFGTRDVDNRRRRST